MRYVDPDGRFCQIFTLNSDNQENLIWQLVNNINAADNVSNFSTLASLFSMIPFAGSTFFGNASTIISANASVVSSMPNEIISTYYETQVSALKNYSNGKVFDENCSLELAFATLDKYVGKQNDFATVWKMLLENPNIKTSDLPDKYTTEYYVTLRWKDENGKTLAGKTIQLSNQIEFESFIEMVIDVGGINEE